MTFLKTFWRRITPQRNDILGREQGQTLVRVTIVTALLGYLIAAHSPIDYDQGLPGWMILLLAYLSFSLALAVTATRSHRSPEYRRIVANIGDTITVTYLMVNTGEAGPSLFLLYLWVMLGNGFRFGIKAMGISAALSVVGFSVVIAFTEFWRQHGMLTAGVIALLVLLPAFAAHRIRQLHRVYDHAESDNNGTPNSFLANMRQQIHTLLNGALCTTLINIWRRVTPRHTDILGREQGQAFLRVVVGIVVVTYLIIHHYPIDFSQGIAIWLVFVVAFLTFSTTVAWVAIRDKRSSVYRRLAANLVDVAAVTYLMIGTGDAGAPLFVIYLWVTLGNGFRFGLAAMSISAVLSIAGFAVVIATTDLWGRYGMLAGGVMLSLVVLPGYAAHLIRQLHRARERAEEANAAKGQFLARMSHELRTPLNGIRGTTDLLRNSRRLTVEEHGLLGVIQESVAASLRQIDSVLDFSRIEAGKLTIEPTDLDLHQLLHSTARIVGPSAREKNLRFLIRISPQAPYRLIGDPHYLREVLLNLLSNAIKFTENGYVALQVEPVDLGPERVRLRFEIRDTGIGIAPEALERIWESFTQEDSGTTRRHGGTGLGTTIAKHLVELMGGHIAVSSIKGRGTVFWCELPFPLQSRVLQFEPVAAGARALLLSADTDTIHNLSQMVENIDRSLVVVSSPEEAIDALGRAIRLGNPAHLILVDDRLVTTTGNRHLADELVDRSLAAQTPLYLVSDAPREAEQLCEWGYAGTVPRRAAPALLATAFRASPYFEAQTNNSPQVVKVEPWAWGQNSTGRRRVLIVDDNRTNRLILEQILKTAGYAVDVASDGEEALEHLATRRHRAAVLDLHMPGLDGVSLLRRYRQLLPARQRVPVVVLTADATFDARSNCAEAGADAFLTKPAVTDTLLATLDRLICEREVRVLPRHMNPFDRATEDAELPVLDTSVLAELDRLCQDPTRLTAVFEAFEAEGKVLLAAITTAAAAHNHPGFAEWVHAMKGNAANVGAMRLMRACRAAEAAGVLDFRRDGKALVQSLREDFSAAQQALRELAPAVNKPERPGPID